MWTAELTEVASAIADLEYPARAIAAVRIGGRARHSGSQLHRRGVKYFLLTFVANPEVSNQVYWLLQRASALTRAKQLSKPT